MGNIRKNYCYKCGSKLQRVNVDGVERDVCSECGEVNYANPIPASAVGIVDEDRILLVKRAIEPKKGLWCLPSGFVEIDETVQECAIREVKEETNLDIVLTGIVDVYTVFEDPRYVCLLVVYTGNVTGGDLAAGDDAEEAAYFALNELPEIAFKKHYEAIKQVFRNRN